MWYIYLTFKLSNIKHNYFESINRKVDQEHIEKPPTIKAACLFCQVKSTALLIFAFMRYMFAVYKYKKNLFVTNSYWFFLFFVNRNPHIFPQKARDRKYWDTQCDRYSKLTALYITISEDSFLISINSDNKISFQNGLCH